MPSLIVADDHNVVRQALCEMLQSRGTFTIVGEAHNGNELLELLKTKRPDLVIMDLTMPQLDGIGTLEQLRAVPNHPPVLVLSAEEGERQVRRAIKAGAKGYISKNAALDELEFAINSILQGKVYLSPTIAGALMSEDSDEAALNVLSKREIEILTHLAEGKPNRDIAKLLHISTRTVDTHRSNILKKLKVRTNAELVKIALSNGLISL